MILNPLSWLLAMLRQFELNVRFSLSLKAGTNAPDPERSPAKLPHGKRAVPTK